MDAQRGWKNTHSFWCPRHHQNNTDLGKTGFLTHVWHPMWMWALVPWLQGRHTYIFRSSACVCVYLRLSPLCSFACHDHIKLGSHVSLGTSMDALFRCLSSLHQCGRVWSPCCCRSYFIARRFILKAKHATAEAINPPCARVCNTTLSHWTHCIHGFCYQYRITV